MSLLEGGALRCSRHEFETKSVSEWNEHCSDGEHFENGSTACITCGEIVEYEALPFHPFVNGSKNIVLQCDDCSKKTKGSAKVKRVAKK